MDFFKDTSEFFFAIIAISPPSMDGLLPDISSGQQQRKSPMKTY
jgi:hypothetical protein